MTITKQLRIFIMWFRSYSPMYFIYITSNR